ncbi:hypothetical protein C8R44DRAFT_763275 [Mycena epipterygia]|nr:hypothetical protein C8R44DRAFT_763275 [Mycena epipterygia]
MCDTIPGCIFANSFFDSSLNLNPDPTNITTTLTCALFATPLTAANATNCGDAETTFIADSYGFVKPDATVAGA